MVCASITLFLVPFGGTSGPVFAEASPQFETPATSTHQLQSPGLSSHRVEPTIAQQFTAGSSNDNSGESETPKLVDLVSKYLTSDSVSERSEIGTEIRKSNEISSVASALREAQVWEQLTQGSVRGGGDFEIQLASADNVTIKYLLPVKYDPRKPYPLAIGGCGKYDYGGSKPVPYPLAVNNSDGNFMQIEVSRPVGGEFHLSPESTGDFRQLIRNIRKRFHIDSARTFFNGCGNYAWSLAVFYGDVFAAGDIRSGFLDSPYRKQLYPLLLKNAESLPIFSGWDEFYCHTAPNAINYWREISQISTQLELPIVSVDMYNMTSGMQANYDATCSAFNKITRPLAPPKLSHYFRYPEQGQCAWLRQTKFAGDVWTAEQLSILPGPEVDSDQYITDVLKSLLAYMGGTIEGNTIRIETRRCADIELLLYENMVDFTKPVVVYINGKKRHDRIVKPSIPTLLEEAYDTFDFQRLVFAKLAFDIKEDSAAPPTK